MINLPEPKSLTLIKHELAIFLKSKNKTSSLPSHYIQAVLVLEDKRFFKHCGFDLVAIVRAMLSNILTNRKSGASTIEQQLVRTITGHRQRTLSRKILEIYLAYIVSSHYSKTDILKAYAHFAYYGRNSTGIINASKTFFGKPLDLLNEEQLYILASSLRYPRSDSKSWFFKAYNRALYAKKKILKNNLQKQKYIITSSKNK